MSDSIAETCINDVSTGETESQPNPKDLDSPENTQNKWLDMLLADAPPDDGSYKSHALNFDKTDSTAKIIRGFEGFAGNLNKALILIVMGVVEKFTENMDSEEKEQENPEDNEENEGFGVLEGDQI